MTAVEYVAKERAKAMLAYDLLEQVAQNADKIARQMARNGWLEPEESIEPDDESVDLHWTIDGAKHSVTCRPDKEGHGRFVVRRKRVDGTGVVIAAADSVEQAVRLLLENRDRGNG